MDDNELT